MYGRWSAPHASLLSTVSHLLILAGIVVGALAGLRMTHDLLQSQIARQAPVRILHISPVIALAPLATPPPVNLRPQVAAAEIMQPVAHQAEPAPLLAPVAAAPTPPLILPPVRIAIPAIEINARINQSPLESWTDRSGQERMRWQDPGRLVGHLAGTGMPGEGDNIVLTGHNNWMGEVFRRLPELHRGDEITLFTEATEHRYRVTERWIVPYRRDPVRGEARLYSYTKATPGEQLTLISCYPYLTNADRIVIIAKPVDEPKPITEAP